MHTYNRDDAMPDIDRRVNSQTAEQVESALVIQRHGDEWGARDYLASVGVPPHIILRVLSCRAFHRKRDR
jgi:hypothetical protein